MSDGLGVSTGDDYYPTPYAYVGPWTQRTGPFWNAPFGALYPLDPAPDVDASRGTSPISSNAAERNCDRGNSTATSANPEDR